MKQEATHLFDPLLEPRQLIDRRGLCPKSLPHILYNGKRQKARRQKEIDHGFYTDRYEKWVGINVIAITLMSVLDAILTLNILDKGGIELNPFMSALLAINTQAFFIGKLTITVSCLFFSLIHTNFRVLRIMPVKTILVCISIFYGFLLGYELCLLAFI
jgi:hypothetical protein